MTSPQLIMWVAQARIDDLRRDADAHRAGRVGRRHAHSAVPNQSVTLRLGTTRDEESLARLALTTAEPLRQPVLLAEVDGQLRAALALCDGTVIADRSHRTADLIDLLRARGRQLTGNTRMIRLRSWARLCPPTRGDTRRTR